MESEPARVALAAFREATRCSEALRDDNLRAIEARLHGAVPRRRPSTVRRTAIVVAVLAAAAIAVWFVGSLSNEVVAVHEDDPRSQAIDAAEGRDTPSATRVARPPVVIPEPPTPPLAAPEPKPRPTTPVQRATPSPEAEWVPPPTAPAADAPVEGALGREARLMSELQREIDARHPLAARRALDAVKRDFPGGVLVEERWALEVKLHCYEYAPDRAAEVAAEFLRTHPRSDLAKRLASDPCPTPKSR